MEQVAIDLEQRPTVAEVTHNMRVPDLVEDRAGCGHRAYMFEHCLGAIVTRGKGKTEVSLSMTLATRTLPIITHAFKDVRSRDAFMSSLAEEDRTMGSVELAELALLEGRAALARKMNSIARNRLPTLH